MAMMILYNKYNGNIYGYFGTPYPTTDKAVGMCFPGEDWEGGYIDAPGNGNGEIWLDDLETTVLGKDDVEKEKYVNFDTGAVWTIEEIREEYDDMSDVEFNEYLDRLIQMGIEGTGGLIKMEDV